MDLSKYKNLRKKDLDGVFLLGREYQMALQRRDYETALTMTGAIDQIFYERGVDTLEFIADLESTLQQSRFTPQTQS